MYDHSDRPSSFFIPLGDAPRGVLELVNGPCYLRLHAAATADRRDAEVLASGSFGGRTPDVRLEDHGRVRIAYQRSLFDLRFDWRSISADVALAPTIPWEVRVRGGVCGLDADLRGVRLAAFEIQGGVSDGRLRLGCPSGEVRVFVLGGAAQLRLCRPADVPVRVVINGGASALAVDTLRLDAVGGHFDYQTPGFAGAPGRYVVEIIGGASALEVSTESHQVVDARVLDRGPLAAGA
jgi:hypothetical protein